MAYTAEVVKDLDATKPTEGAGNSTWAEMNDADRETRKIIKNLNAIVTKTGAYTLTAQDSVILCNGTFTITLPTASTVASATYTKEYTIKNIGTGTITIGGTVDGVANPTIGQYDTIIVCADGTSWYEKKPRPAKHVSTHNPGGGDAVATAVAGAIQPGDSAAEGTAASLARSDHKHSIVAATASVQAFGDTAIEGVATSFARSDHKHGMPTTPVLSKEYVSAAQTITGAALLTLAHGLGVAPKLISFQLKCTTANAGYSVNDEIFIEPVNNASAGSDVCNGIYFDATNIYIRFSNAATAFLTANKTTGGAIFLTNSSWTLKVFAWA